MMIIKTGKAMMIGAGVAAAAAAAAYFLTGERGEENREKVKEWAGKAKKEVLEKLKTAKALTQEGYEAIVDEVVARYEAAKDAAPEELEMLKDELKSHWKNIEKHFAQPAVSKQDKPAVKKAKKLKKS